MAVVLFLLLIPVATFLVALSDYEIAEGRTCSLILFMLLSTILTPDVQSAIIVCTAAVIEFEAALYLLRKAHA
jgi:hypothetical protein